MQGTRERIEPDTITAKEMARKLGVSIQTIYKWINEGRIPGIHLGGAYFADREQFEEWYETKVKRSNVFASRTTQEHVS